MSMENPARLDAAREAERALWKHYDLEMSERFIEVGTTRRRVRILECGNAAGEPLVLVQGGLGEAFNWASLLPKLRDFRCITLDRPGSGLSDGVDFGNVDVRALAVEVLTAMLDALGVDRAAFVGNSMGGWWSMNLAIAAPERVSKLVLIGCPALLLDSSAPLPMRLMSLPVIGRRLTALLVPTSVEKARALPGFLGHPKEVGQRWPSVQAEVIYQFGQLPDYRHSWTTLLRRFLRLRGHSELQITPDQLRTVRQPTLFVWGTGDPFGSVDVGRRAVEYMSNARLEIAGIGHLPWWDDADACARLIHDFLGAPAAAANVQQSR